MENTGTRTQPSQTLTRLFADKAAAEHGYKVLEDLGYGPEEINVVMADETRKRYFAADESATESENKLGHDVSNGAVIGGTVGTTLAGIAAIGVSIVLPGFGLLVAGPVAVALAAAAAGGAMGGVIGAFLGAAYSAEEAKQYEDGIANGGIAIGVTPRTPKDLEFIKQAWN